MDYSTVPVSSGAAAGMGIGFFIIWLIVAGIMVAALWKIFAKAGKPGWAAIIPIYNIIVLLEIIGKPVWWLLMFCIPFVNLVFYILTYIELAKKFGKDTGFAIGMIIIPIVFLPILGFGKSTYQG
jgi:hypothetical protein